MKYTIEKMYLTAPSKRRSGIKMDKVKFLVAHDTGNPGSTALQNVKYYENSRNEMSASAHIFVDDRQIIECIPFLLDKPEKAWHVVYNTPVDDQLFGDDANDVAGGIELCYGGKINNQEAYRKFVWVVAYACHVHAINPIKMITGHFILDPKRKTDPQASLKLVGKTMLNFIEDVAKELKDCTT
jgi:N-acetylmuramoyl-L-alanine amidase